MAVSQLAGVPMLVHTPAYATSFSPEQLQGQVLLKVDAFNDIWSAALILFGVHLTLVGQLAYRSEVVPRIVAVLLVIAGAGYVLDSVVSVFVDAPTFTVSSVTFVGEFLLALWLVFRGHRLAPAEKPLTSTAA